MKTCSKCKVDKESTEFYARKALKSGLRSDCKSCFDVMRKKLPRNPDGQGILPNSEKMAILALQGGVCAICKSDQNGSNWCTDHCHETKKIRGVLCTRCNVMIGMAKNNVATLAGGISYLNSGIVYGYAKK